jgi:hypothetical protein
MKKLLFALVLALGLFRFDPPIPLCAPGLGMDSRCHD